MEIYHSIALLCAAQKACYTERWTVPASATSANIYKHNIL